MREETMLLLHAHFAKLLVTVGTLHRLLQVFSGGRKTYRAPWTSATCSLHILLFFKVGQLNSAIAVPIKSFRTDCFLDVHVADRCAALWTGQLVVKDLAIVYFGL
jgi:hypothetical protein